MPEGPEVRRYADAIAAVLVGQPILSLTARTKAAKQWLQAHPDALTGRQIEAVQTHGKNLIGWIEGGYYFYSHLMMWGRWFTVTGAPPSEIDRRERARIVTPQGAALLHSAPIFELGAGDPTQLEVVRSLGTDILPYAAPFNDPSFRQQLLSAPHRDREIGAALLDQTIVAGIGNYLRAEILFDCRIDPWRKISQLSTPDLDRLCAAIPRIARRAYETGGITVSDGDRIRMQQDPTLVYRLGSDFGSRHYVFRRTNLPCLVCTTPIRQLRQTTHQPPNPEKSRITYFCPTCQHTQTPLKTKSKHTKTHSTHPKTPPTVTHPNPLAP